MEKINISEWFGRKEGRVLFDVRSPGEYAQGHIPGAVSLPLFSDEERAIVGTLYKQVSPEKAFFKGLEFAGAKMPWYVSEAMKSAPGKRVGVHCWRGGKRSASMGNLLGYADFDVLVLDGGYKAYRQFALENFAQRRVKFLVLGGKTGSGKTQVLHQLRELGEQVIDLEGLANHKGSAFGALGEVPQPRSEQFENEVFELFYKMGPSKRIWVENESRNIGKVFIPAGFWEQLKSSPVILLDVPIEQRIERAMEEYAHFPTADLIASFLKIEKRMGGQHVKAAIEALNRSDLLAATTIAMHYYDKTYVNSTAKGNFSRVFDFPTDQADCEITARNLIAFANDHDL